MTTATRRRRASDSLGLRGEAMSSPRPHRAASSPEAAVAACQEVLAGDESPLRAGRSW